MLLARLRPPNSGRFSRAWKHKTSHGHQTQGAFPELGNTKHPTAGARAVRDEVAPGEKAGLGAGATGTTPGPSGMLHEPQLQTPLPKPLLPPGAVCDLPLQLGFIWGLLPGPGPGVSVNNPLLPDPGAGSQARGSSLSPHPKKAKSKTPARGALSLSLSLSLSPTQPRSCWCPVDPQKPPGHVAGTGITSLGLGSPFGTGMQNMGLGSQFGTGITVWDQDAELGSGCRIWDWVHSLGLGSQFGIRMQNLGPGCRIWDWDESLGSGCRIWDWDAEPGTGIRVWYQESRGPVAHGTLHPWASSPRSSPWILHGKGSLCHGVSLQCPGKAGPGMNEGSVLQPQHELPAFSRLPAWNGAGNAAGSWDRHGGTAQGRVGSPAWHLPDS
ncbi:uncharacterized protein LOC131590933 isoform X2 [Poecile atricapillus]|uniref:uncharacterized protein LOC131590933 isoform X2 n=1 Tax=Poecile atricapillus TaxID=48891 RepID=UPI0027397C4E|nr:uncharacterized protein LOC131590933 isoform X2 [Poecile atricapillus]